MINPQNLLTLPPLSLYVHIPWCVRKCPYCDFNSHLSVQIPEQQYVARLISDLEQELQYVEGRPLQSIFFGGGTPSLFSGKAIANILNAVEQRISFVPGIEITLEANPGTVEQQKFFDYFAAGVNRLSIGMQSFNSKHLASLGRIHSNQDAIRAADSARKAGFSNFNIDLMHGLSDQTQQQALEDVLRGISLNPKHLSWYQLTIEPNTAFYNQPPQLPSDDQLADIQQAGELLLAEHNYQHYEISAYTQPGYQSTHNLNYWQFGDYLGIGAGAHCKQTSISSKRIIRRWKTRSPRDYLDPTKRLIAGEKSIPSNELALEFMMNNLRLINGFDTRLYSLRTGQELSHIEGTIHQLKARGLLQQQHHVISTTPLGQRFLNDILAEF